MSAQVLVDIKEAPGEMMDIEAQPVITKYSTPREIAIAKLVVALVDSKINEAAALDKQEKGGAK